MRGGRAARPKGNRSERALAQYLRDAGIDAQRVPGSGQAGGRFGADVHATILGDIWKLEAKVRGRDFIRLYRWLADGADALVVRADRHEPLVVLPLSRAVALLAKAQRRRGDGAGLGVEAEIEAARTDEGDLPDAGVAVIR